MEKIEIIDKKRLRLEQKLNGKEYGKKKKLNTEKQKNRQMK